MRSVPTTGSVVAASYEGAGAGFDLFDRALECTKTTLGLKLFLTLAWAGERELGDYVASRYDMARWFHDALEREPRVSCPYVPESDIVCFQVAGIDQLALRDRMLAGGRLHIGSTTIGGERYLRLVIMAPDTGEETLQELLRTVRVAA